MKKLCNLMVIALIISALSLLFNLANAPIMQTDNMVHVNDTIDYNRQIQNLEQQSEQSNSYTKQYKRRNDYGKNPISSESIDYKDNIIQEIVTQNNESKSENRASETSDLTKDVKNYLDENSNDKLKENIDKDSKQYDRIIDNDRAKLVIIIDDIANKNQLKEIQKINLKLTPSVFPIAKNDLEMAKAVNNLFFFMVHLPLEAKKYTDGLDTLKLNDTNKKIEQKIAEIKEMMPKIKFINNHTGSKFTESKSDMERLLSVLDSYNIAFIDSRTTPNSALIEIAKEKNRLILYRDVFVDNNLNLSSINSQLKEGVKIASQRGYAILIGHPHKETLTALKIAKNDILKNVDVIYLNELYEILLNAKITQYAQKINKSQRKYNNN